MRQLLVFLAPVALAACTDKQEVVATNNTVVESAVAPTDENMAATMNALDGNTTDHGVTDHGVTDHGVTDH